MQNKDSSIGSLKMSSFYYISKIKNSQSLEIIYGLCRRLFKEESNNNDDYKSLIILLLQQINNEKFLKRIYIALREYIKDGDYNG